MAAAKSVKARKTVSRIVGVITTTAELRTAIEMSDRPDLFELRLDRLVGDLDELEEKIPRLRAPLIITARHPAEGGANDLSKARRAELLSRFLPRAQYVDLELRSLKALRSSVNLSSHKHVRLIVSFHD